MKRYADRSRRETEEWKKRDSVLLSTKDLVFKERPVKKLTERYVGPYVKIVDGGLYFIFPFHFLFLYFLFSFNFLFLEQLGLGVISHAVTT